MRRMLSALCCALLIGLCACGNTAPGAVSETLPPAAPAQTPAPETVSAPEEEHTEPVLSDGAAEDSRLSGTFAEAGGVLYTSLVRAEGLVCLYDVLPEDVGYIPAFVVTDDAIVAVVRDAFYSLEPASLRRFPFEGTPELLADGVATGGAFYMAGDSLFYETYEGGLTRLELTTGETFPALTADARPLAAYGGFLYYFRDGMVYRNDSTMSAESAVFAADSVSRLFADAAGVYALVNHADGAALQLRGPDGTLRRELALTEAADDAAMENGLIYLPQGGTVLAIDPSDGGEALVLTLPVWNGYCLLYCVTEDALYYETFSDGAARLYRLSFDGTYTELGETIMP